MQHLAIAQDYSLLLIDTDRFKHINDLYGHSKGDEVLCALARTLESCARKGDLVFRWGGEEFVLLLPRTPLDTALSLAETIRVSVAKVSISGLPRFTVSIGVAHHEGNESIDELFKRVDDALYRAKMMVATACWRHKPRMRPRSTTALSVALPVFLASPAPFYVVRRNTPRCRHDAVARCNMPEHHQIRSASAPHSCGQYWHAIYHPALYHE